MDPAVPRSIDDLRVYSQALATRRVEDDPVVRTLRSASRLVWLGMLAGAFLCYYLLSKMQEALNMLI